MKLAAAQVGGAEVIQEAGTARHGLADTQRQVQICNGCGSILLNGQTWADGISHSVQGAASAWAPCESVPLTAAATAVCSMYASCTQAGQGGWVHVFPEGRIHFTGALGPFKWGVGKLVCDARKAGGGT
jgi:hypothetical protein